MTRETDYLIQSLFEKESLEEMTLDEFRSTSEQYPYSSIVQFLYSCKLKSVYHLDFPEQVTHSALFFPSPQWLNYQLSDESEIGNFRLNQYDLNFNNVTEDVPLEIEQTIEDSWEYDEEQSNFSSTDNEMAPVESVEELTQHQPLIQTEENPVQALQIPIEPYHTVDYFASQGIKTLLDNQNDDLGKKVRSFTAWLKTMKSLQPVQGNDQIEDDDEEIDNGNGEQVKAEIIATEAMAEVYLKQGLAHKAIEVYAKLSLQNPANSHIFASKIIQIKENKI
jgi:hypothetical protein